MNRDIVLAGRVLTPTGIIESGIVQVRGGVIRSVGERAAFQGNINIDVGEHLIAPGFIDIHVHGAAGHSFMNAGTDGIREILSYHRKHGTTSLLATTLTASDESICAALSNINNFMECQKSSSVLGSCASILGVHIEGPYLNVKRAGAQNPEWLRTPNVEEYSAWESLAFIRMITIAPELKGAERLISYIRNQGNVLISAGHTDATFEEMEKAIAWGVTHCTHFGNGMRGLHHREPGVFGTGLLVPELTVEMIADGIHLHPKILELVYRTKGADRTVLITDAVAFAGMKDGNYPHSSSDDNRGVIVENGVVRMQHDGGLAGSSLTMNRAAKKMSECGSPLLDIWKMAAEVPARLIGLDNQKGKVKPGMDADLIVMNRDFDVLLTLVEGCSNSNII